MKNNMLIFIIISLSLCSLFNYKNTNCSNISKTMLVDTQKYEVLKIDSINSFYIVYLIKDNIKYKVISKKTEEKTCSTITQHEKYIFNLSSVKFTPIKFGNFTIVESLTVDCFPFDEQTTICTEEKEGIYDLYLTNNLKGLCYIECP